MIFTLKDIFSRGDGKVLQVIETELDEYFDNKYSRQIAWNDSQIAIQYPVKNPILAQHDIDAPKLRDSDCNL